MRAPQLSDLGDELPDIEDENPFYTDSDLEVHESTAGYIAPASVRRAMRLLKSTEEEVERVTVALGRFATETKDWITPETLSDEETAGMLTALKRGARISVHGMARIAYDDRNLYVNGRYIALPDDARPLVAKICAERRFAGKAPAVKKWQDSLAWMLKMGAFEIPENP
jgi:hypothetical protein